MTVLNETIRYDANGVKLGTLATVRAEGPNLFDPSPRGCQSHRGRRVKEGNAVSDGSAMRYEDLGFFEQSIFGERRDAFK